MSQTQSVHTNLSPHYKKRREDLMLYWQAARMVHLKIYSRQQCEEILTSIIETTNSYWLRDKFILLLKDNDR